MNLDCDESPSHHISSLMERKISKIFTPLLHRTLVKGGESSIKEKRNKQKENMKVSKKE